MIFLGLAANYSAGAVFRHLFATGGEDHSEALRQYLAQKYSTPECELSSNQVALYHNGRSALSVAVRNLVPRGSQVVVNGFTCQAVVQAVKEAKCKPVYADINPETLHFNAATLRKCLRKHPDAQAIIVQNTLGMPVDMAEIEAVARSRKLVIIEDLAHSVGQHYPDGREVGTVGAATALSFGKGKAVDTISGGALIMRRGEKLPFQPMESAPLSDRWRDRLYPLFGLITRGLYHVGGLGKYYMSFLVKTGQVRRSADAEVDPHVALSHWQAKLALTQLQMLEVLPALAEAPIRRFFLVEEREEVLDKLEKAHCYLREFWYEKPIAPARYYRRQKFPEEECPVAVQVATQIINLPTYYDAEELKPALAIIHGEDPRAEERARRAAKVAAKAARMEAKAERIKSGELEVDARSKKEKAQAAEAEVATAAAATATATADDTGDTKTRRRRRRDRQNEKIAAARAAETGGFEAGFRATDLDFLEILEEATEATSASVTAAASAARKITNKAPAPVVQPAPAAKPAPAPTTSSASSKRGPRVATAQPVLKAAPKPQPAVTRPRKVLKEAQPAAKPVTTASQVLKSKKAQPAKPKAAKNEFFKQKGGGK